MSNDECKFIRDIKLYIALWENTATNLKRLTVAECIESGADVNVKFINNANNTPLHVAVSKGEREIVNILLKHGAKTDIVNDAGKTALDIAKELPDSSDIVEILKIHEKVKATEQLINSNRKDELFTLNNKCVFKKRSGTANVRGQLYETKLLTLIYLRALRSKRIKDFCLATNVDDIGDLDDVCMRARIGNQDCAIFVQAKYRHDIVKGRVGVQDLWKSSGDFSLLKYFDSYVKIRDKFNNNCDDPLFHGKYEDIKCHYVIYTTIKDDVKDTRKKSVRDDDVTDLIGTGEHHNVFQFICEEQYINSLTNVKLVERVRQMGKKLIKFIQDDKFDMMLCDENLRSFHVVLAQKVIKVSDVNSKGHRTGTFRHEFFASNEQLLIVLRETLCAEIVKDNKLTIEEIEASIQRIIIEPTAATISELIGSVLMYDSNSSTLKIIDETIERNFAYDYKLESSQVGQSEVNEALEIAGKKKLEKISFKLPTAFGNFDMTVNKKKADRRLDYLAGKIFDLIQKSADADGNVIIREGSFTPDKQLESGILGINGGIAGAVGNLLLSDDDDKLKFNMNVDSLGENARKLFTKLSERLGDVSKYRFCVEIEDFPRLSMRATDYEKRFARDFFKNLYFYTCQAKEEDIEEIATKELQTYEFKDIYSKSESRILSNAAFLKLHNEIQIWWMIEQTPECLTRSTEKFSNIFSDLKNKGLLSFLTYVYLNELNKTGIEFKEDAVEFLTACDHDKNTADLIVIHSDACRLTCHKLMQYFKAAKDYAFVDIDYICRVSPNWLDMVDTELNKIDTHNIIIVSEDLTKTKFDVEDMVRTFKSKRIIWVTSSASEKYLSLNDDKNNLNDLTDESQQKILQNQFIYQGVEVTFGEVFADAKHLINAKILQKIINNEKIVVGPTLDSPTYEEIKHYYVPRVLERNLKTYNNTDFTDKTNDSLSSAGSLEDNQFSVRERLSPSTLLDHYDVLEDMRFREKFDVVLVLDAPGMGKSTLLTHLSLETKRQHPEIWIQRINLIDHTKQFHDWHENGTEVDIIEALKFVSKVVLCKETNRGRTSNPIGEIHFQVINGDINLVDCKVDSLLERFELDTFLNCFKEEKVIFLFDGFDEVSPHYTNEVTQLLKSLTKRNPFCTKSYNGDKESHLRRCVWITSRPYNDLKHILESEFGDSFTLLPFSHQDINAFVYKYMKRNVNLGTLTQEQLKNIDGFFEFMKKFDLRSSSLSANNINVTNIQLHSIYTAALEYFKMEAKRTHFSQSSSAHVQKWDFQEDILLVWRLFGSVDDYTKAITLSGVPLNVYIAINYLESQIKDTRMLDAQQRTRQWDLDTNTFAFYERFLEMKLKNIRFAEKNRMDIYIPDIKLTYDREMKEFRDKHKKLAFYTVFEKNALTEEELCEVDNIMKSMEIGEEKTGLVDRIVNGTPKFVHYTFAEYFAVEHIFDMLKSGEPNKQQRILDFILKEMILYSKEGLRVMFDLKLKCTSGLTNAINNDFVNQYIFRTLVQQRRDVDHRTFPGQCATVLDVVVEDKLTHFAEFLIDAVVNTVDKTNADDFIYVVQESAFLNKLMDSKNKKLMDKIMNCIASVEPTKLYSVLGYVWANSMTPPF